MINQTEAERHARDAEVEIGGSGFGPLLSAKLIEDEGRMWWLLEFCWPGETGPTENADPPTLATAVDAETGEPSEKFWYI
jgi:hypothetical protein